MSCLCKAETVQTQRLCGKLRKELFHMIDKRLVPYGGLKKEAFSGSHHGMRYLMNGDDGKNSTTFTVWIYPEPWCFEQTPDEEKESAVFPLSEEGMDQAVAWLNERYEAEKERWNRSLQDMMHTLVRTGR